MSCDICKRTSCCKAFHSFEEQERWQARQEMSDDVEVLRQELQEAQEDIKTLSQKIYDHEKTIDRLQDTIVKLEDEIL